MENLLQDFRYGLRTLLKRPGVAAVAIVTLALGIGANTAIFSVINAVLLRPLPYPEPDRLTKVLQSNTEPGKFSNPAVWPYPRFEALRDRNQSLAGVAAYAQRSYNLTGVDLPERLDVEFVSAFYFDVLGIKAAVGRTFTPGEDIPQGPQGVALISHDLWQRRFGADPGITERVIELEKRSLLIAGVLPAGFKGQSGAVDVWLPMMMVPEFLSKQLLVNPLSYWIHVIARLKPGVTLGQARAEMSILSGEIEKLYPGPAQGRPSGTGQEFIDLVPLREAQVNPVFRSSFLILLAAVGLVVLIACANISNLLLARAVARQKEFAVRLALCASRGRIIRQLLTENATIALSGGALGLIVALWGIDLLNQFKPIDAGQFWTTYAQTFTLFKVRLDGWVLAFNFLMAALTGVLFGLVPAWQASRPNINPALQGSAGGPGARFRGPGQRARRLLVVAEIAMSLVLLAGAGLMIRSLAKLNAVDLGFDPENVITMQVYSREASEEFYMQLRERAAALPGVESASVAGTAPLSGFGAMSSLEVEGRETTAAIHSVSPDYFRTLRINIIKGRAFGDRDRIGGKRVAILNRAAAERFFHGQDPLGMHINVHLMAHYPGAEQLIEVVGVAEDVRYGRIDEVIEPEIYLSAWQPVMSHSTLIIRGSVDPAALVSAVRREVRLLDPNLPVYGIRTMRERVAEATSRTRFIALMLSLFAGLALTISAIGIYGVMAYAVSVRTKEIGIRRALGAQTGDVMRLVMRQGMGLTVAGLVIGIAASYAVTHVLSSQLYGVTATDPATFALIVILLASVALAACYIPARRAAGVDPMAALRYE